MKHILALSTALLTLASCGTRVSEPAEAPFEVRWDVENLVPDSTGRHYRQSIRMVGDLRGVSRVAFSQFARRMTPADPSDTIIEMVPGYYVIGSPRFAAATGRDTLEFDIMTAGAIYQARHAPEGFHAVMTDGRVLPVRLIQADMTARASGYSTDAHDYMPYGDAIYARNEEIAGGTAGVYDIVPSFKKVEPGSGKSMVNLDRTVYRTPSEPLAEGEYRITVGQGVMTVEAPEKMWPALRLRLANAFGTGTRELPDAVITDRPSMPYRGLMIDIARNYQQPAELHKLLDIMATYGLNVFHFHFSDDEGWRLEIPSLPELAEVGGRRGYNPDGKADCLPQFFGGDGNPESATSNNGYLTRSDYIALLRHADSLGISVIPEIESPGHARAAIKAMEVRARRTGDPSWLLQEPGDTSVYTSAQSFHDNVMNPALESPYRFVSMVADDIAAMHREAGVPLRAIHIGGDEVPRGAWGGSPAVQALKDSLGISTDMEAHAVFVKRIARILAEKDIPTSGWQEIAWNHDKDYNDAIRPDIYSVNCWRTLSKTGHGKVVDEVAAAGFPVVLSNAQHFYFDLCYSRHPYERGLTWAGTTDEFSSLSGYPAKLCTVKGAKVLGVQGQIWSETIRDAANLEELLFPKILGLAERGWNPDSTYSEPDFHAVVLKEIPKWESASSTYHVRQPGLKLEDGRYLKINSPYPDAEIRITTDGSEPTADMPAIAPGATINLDEFNAAPRQVRARLWLNGHPSVTTILNIDR